jgi:hypothetical protein
MTFPAVAATSVSSEASDTTTHTVTIPAVSGGNLILINAGINGNPTVTKPSGFDFIFNYPFSNGTQAIFAKVAAGTEAGTVDFSTDASEESSHTVYVIGSWYGSLAGVEVSNGDQSNSDAPNPDAITATWGSADNLFIATNGLRRGRAVTGWPGSYTGSNISEATDAATSGSGAAMATRNLASATDDPGAFGLDGSTPWGAATLVVRPASAGGSFQAAWAINSNVIIQGGV